MQFFYVTDYFQPLYYHQNFLMVGRMSKLMGDSSWLIEQSLKSIFTFSSHIKRYEICVTFEVHIFNECPRFIIPWIRKKNFISPVCPPVVVVVICGHENSQKNYQIEMCFNTLYQGQKGRTSSLTSYIRQNCKN